MLLALSRPWKKGIAFRFNTDSVSFPYVLVQIFDGVGTKLV